MSKVIVTVDHQFQRTPDGKVWVKTIYGYDFWKRYLQVFDEVRIVGRVRPVEKIEEKMLLSSGDGVEFFDLPHYRGLKEYLLQYTNIQRAVKTVTDGCDCAIFRIPSPIANMIHAQVVKKDMPWAVEVVNDPWDNFAPGTFKSIFRPVYRYWFTKQVKDMSKKANGASYVTQFALQKNYPNYAMLYGESKEHFESYYSSITLKKDYIWKERGFDAKKARLEIIHVNSCVTDFSKGHDVVIRVCKILRKKGLNVYVTFVGDGPMRADFEKMAADVGVEEYVHFTGLLSGANEVREKLLNADILIFPTLGEGLPRTVIEAMAVGLPCLSTPVAGIPELLADEDMFEQQDAEAFAKRAYQILSNEEEYIQISKRNVSKTEEYEESILTDRRNEFYEKLKILAY